MREELGKYFNEEITVTGEFLCYARTNGLINLLFRNIMYNGELVADHIWVRLTNVRNKKELDINKMKKHDMYELTGRVLMYNKLSKEHGGKVKDYGFKKVKIKKQEDTCTN